MPRITVDGHALDAPEGSTLLEALDGAGLLGAGVDVPHYCWHPKLSVEGSCGLCQVEVEGYDELQVACTLPVREGMTVLTASPGVMSARSGVLELLLVNHPPDCPICDRAGECELQDHAVAYVSGPSRAHEPRRALAKNIAVGPRVVLDQERCVLCRRCVRFCREVTGTGELGLLERGEHTVVGTYPGAPLDNDYSMNVADLCPVGALTTRDFRFKVRVWQLEDAPGLCTGCSSGCNVTCSVSRGEIQRFVPRRNDAVNETWMCDSGRLSYREIATADRLTSPTVRSRDGRVANTSVEQAIGEAALRLRRLVEAKGAGVVAGVASAHATNEDLFVFQRFLDALGTESCGVAVPRGASDALLVKAEKAANAAGARALGIGDARVVADRIRNGAIDGLLCFTADFLDAGMLGDADLLTGLDTVIGAELRYTGLSRLAHVVLPTCHALEKRGTFTNHAARVQGVEPVVEAPGAAMPDGWWIHKLGSALGLPGFEGEYDPALVSESLSRSVPGFEGVHLGSVGPGGLPLADPASALAADA